MCTVLKEFASHSDETDPERIEQIIRRALQDAEWVVQKVNKSTKRVKVDSTDSGVEEACKKWGG